MSADRPPRTRRARLARVLAPLCVALAAFWAFQPALAARFVVFDDDQNILFNESFRGFSADHLAWMWTTRHMGHWQPLSWMSLALDHALWDLDPFGYHLTNVVLHVAAALLVYACALRLFVVARPALAERPLALRAGAAFAAAFFAAHPLRAESVAWVTERRDVLSAALLLGALLVWLRAVRPGELALRSRAAGWTALALLTLSLCSKAWGMTFFVLLLVLDVWPLRRVPSPAGFLREPGRRLLLEKLPFAVLGLAAAGISSWAIRMDEGTTKTLAEWSVPQRIGQAFHGLAYYVHQTAWPHDLIAIRELPVGFDPFTPATLGIAAAVTAAAGAVFALRRRWPALCTAAVVYALLISPVLGFQQAGPQFVADRYSYLACIPFALLLGGLLAQRLTPGAASWPAAAGALLVIGALLPLARAQARTWLTTESLFANVLRVRPQSAMGNLGLGHLRLRQKRLDEALAHFERAVASDPRSGRAWSGIGAIRRARREFAAAEAAYLTAVECAQPRYPVLVDLANLYLGDLGRSADGIARYREAVAEIERLGAAWFDPRPYLGLGTALHQAGQREAARPYLDIAAGDARTRAQALALLRP